MLERGVRAQVPPEHGLSIKHPKTVHVIAQSHIDIIWYWPLDETVRMVLDTFRGHADLLESNPDLTFCQSQFALFEMVLQEDPNLFNRIKRLVKERRWELVGGEWVEPGVIIPGPEAQVRQFLIGQRFAQEHFGTKATVGWSPDSFIMHGSCTPQLMLQAGLRWFVHKRPREVFMNLPTLPYRWRGNDGSEVLALRSNNKGQGVPILSDGIEAPLEKGDLAVIAESFEDAGIHHLWGPMGVGDTGGINSYELPDFEGPFCAEFSTPSRFFTSLEEQIEFKNLPVVEGPLGPAFTGCLTSWAKVKHLNREAENRIQQTEFLISVCKSLGLPSTDGELDQAWRRLLLVQFHDSIAGVCTEPIQVQVEHELNEVLRQAEQTRQRYARRIAESVKSNFDHGLPLTVFNPLGHKRSDAVEARLSLPDNEILDLVPYNHDDASHHEADARCFQTDEELEAVDESGRSVPVLIERFARKQARYIARVRLVAEDVPAFGFKTFNIRIRRTTEPVTKIDGSTVKTDRLNVKFNSDLGGIERLELDGRIVIQAGATTLGELQIYETGKYALHYGFEHRQWETGFTGATQRIYPATCGVRRFNGDRVEVRFEYPFNKSHFRQEFLLEPGVPWIDVRIAGEFFEVERYLKAHFALGQEMGDEGFADQPFGFTRPLPQGMEYPMQYVSGLVGSQRGLAVMNRGRYGCMWNQHTLSISLIRCATFPARISDRGPFEVHLRLLPFDASDQNWPLQINREAWGYNVALCSYAAEHSSQQLAPSWSLLGRSIDQAIACGLKPAEDAQGLAMRIFNPSPNSNAVVPLNRPSSFNSMSMSNILEELPEEVDEDRKGQLSLRPFEIKTVRMT